LIDCLESIYAHREEIAINIHVQDNNSGENFGYLKQRFPEIVLTENQTNIGFAAAANRALRKANARYMLLLNPDTKVINGFLRSIINYMETHQDVGILGPKILNGDDTIQGSARSFPTPLTSLFGRNSPISKLFPNNSITARNVLTIKNEGKTPLEVDWVSGACMLIRRRAYLQIGGFDERFFMYWEDADWCRRFQTAGWKVVYFPGAEIYHSVGKSSNSVPYSSTYHFHKSCYLLFEKYASWPMTLFQPLAVAGLSFRCIISMAFHYTSNVLNNRQSKGKPEYRSLESKDNKIRILRIISRMNIGGPSIHVKNLTEKIDPQSFKTQLITGSLSPHEGDMSYILNVGPGSRTYVPELQRDIDFIKDVKALLKIMKEVYYYHPNIVHSHMSKAGTVARLSVLVCNLFREDKIKSVHTFHGNVLDSYFSDWKSNLFKYIERCLAWKTDRIVAISATQNWELSCKYKITRKEKIKTINLGFDLLPFAFADRFKGTLKKQLGLAGETCIVGIIGRLTPIKNHRMFLDAARMFVDRFNSNNVKFLVVGDGELRTELEQYTTENGLQDHVIFYGWEKDIQKIYADLDVLALTSLNEGTPVSVIEAMASSVPVITTGVGGIKDLLGKLEQDCCHTKKFQVCERGVLCPINDPISFADGLSHIIQNGYRSNKERTKRAQEYVMSHYSQERLVRDIENLYYSLLKI
jgi:GT2 family glycosyltransferase/glycosyltransferase involved in cell wall biosynthesis